VGLQGWKDVKNLMAEAVDRWFKVNAPRLGAALAFYATLALAPLVVICISLVALVFGANQAEGRVAEQIRDLAGPAVQNALELLLLHSSKASGILAGAVSLVTLWFGASGVLVELQDSLNIIWDVKPKRTGFRALIHSRFLSFLMILGIGLFLLLSLLLSAAIAVAGKWFTQFLPAPAWLLHVATLAFSLLVSTGLFAAVYKTVPATRIEWRDVWVGGAVTAALFSVGRTIIGLYIGRAGVGSAYGAAASLVVFLVWVYYSAQVFFLGAEFTRAYAERHGSRAGLKRVRGPHEKLLRPA
jgi:membrane protein